jgi:hypothetical protein
MPIAARFAVTLAPARRAVVWSTTYTGSRESLREAGLVTREQFPESTKARSSSNGGHPQAGRWYVWQEKRQLQRHLLNEFQITPETIGDMVTLWRAGGRERAAQPFGNDRPGTL